MGRGDIFEPKILSTSLVAVESHLDARAYPSITMMTMRCTPSVPRLLVLRRPTSFVVRSIRENPQNTGNPVVVPEPDFDCIAAVQVQLHSLQNPNDPWPNHGTQMAYNFAYDVGGLDPSVYFAYPTDLYVAILART